MKLKLFLYGLPFLFAFFIYFFDSFQLMTGPHGGEYKSVQNYNIEVKTIYPFFYSYLLDNKKQPIKNKGIFCQITFLLPNEKSIEVQLKPYREDGFIMESSSLVYNSFRVQFNIFGKLVSATFENESSIVEQKQSIINH